MDMTKVKKKLEDKKISTDMAAFLEGFLREK